MTIESNTWVDWATGWAAGWKVGWALGWAAGWSAGEAEAAKTVSVVEAEAMATETKAETTAV